MPTTWGYGNFGSEPGTMAGWGFPSVGPGFTLSLADSFSISDDLVKVVGIVLSDSFSIIDIIDLLNAVSIAFTDAFSISDDAEVIKFIPPLIFSELFSMSDEIALFIFTIIIKYAHIEDDEYTIDNVHIR